MYTLTLQAFANRQWSDPMTLIFVEPEKGFEGACRIGYKTDYIANNLESIDLPFCKAVSVRLPLDWDSTSLKKAPAFLFDIAPAGAAKRFLMARLGQDKPEGTSA